MSASANAMMGPVHGGARGRGIAVSLLPSGPGVDGTSSGFGCVYLRGRAAPAACCTHLLSTLCKPCAGCTLKPSGAVDGRCGQRVQCNVLADHGRLRDMHVRLLRFSLRPAPCMCTGHGQLALSRGRRTGQIGRARAKSPGSMTFHGPQWHVKVIRRSPDRGRLPLAAGDREPDLAGELAGASAIWGRACAAGAPLALQGSDIEGRRHRPDTPCQLGLGWRARDVNSIACGRRPDLGRTSRRDFRGCECSYRLGVCLGRYGARALR